MKHLILVRPGEFDYKNHSPTMEGLRQIKQLGTAIKYTLNHAPVYIISSTAFPSIKSAEQLALELNLQQEIEINPYFNDFNNGYQHEEWPGSYIHSNSIIHKKLEQAQNLIIVSNGRTLNTLFSYARFTYYDDPGIMLNNHSGTAIDMDLEQKIHQIIPTKEMKKAMKKEQSSIPYRTEQEDFI